MVKHIIRGWLSLLVVALLGAIAVGQDFRMDTEVFVGDDKQPIAETLTLFSGGTVYDFLRTDPQEITIFDPKQGRFTLLDAKRKLKTSISTQEVLDCCLQINSLATESNNTLFAFAAQPKFELKEDVQTVAGQSLPRLSFTSAPLIYVATAKKPEQAEAAATYRYFADWYARLNALRPGNLPPEARLEINRALADRGLLPVEIERVVVPGNPLKKSVQVRSKHLANWTLSRIDRQKISDADTQKIDSTFRSVPFDEYVAADRKAPAPQQAKR